MPKADPAMGATKLNRAPWRGSVPDVVVAVAVAISIAAGAVARSRFIIAILEPIQYL